MSVFAVVEQSERSKMSGNGDEHEDGRWLLSTHEVARLVKACKSPTTTYLHA